MFPRSAARRSSSHAAKRFFASLMRCTSLSARACTAGARSVRPARGAKPPEGKTWVDEGYRALTEVRGGPPG